MQKKNAKRSPILCILLAMMAWLVVTVPSAYAGVIKVQECSVMDCNFQSKYDAFHEKLLAQKDGALAAASKLRCGEEQDYRPALVERASERGSTYGMTFRGSIKIQNNCSENNGCTLNAATAIVSSSAKGWDAFSSASVSRENATESGIIIAESCVAACHGGSLLAKSTDGKDGASSEGSGDSKDDGSSKDSGDGKDDGSSKDSGDNKDDGSSKDSGDSKDDGSSKGDDSSGDNASSKEEEKTVYKQAQDTEGASRKITWYTLAKEDKFFKNSSSMKSSPCKECSQDGVVTFKPNGTQVTGQPGCNMCQGGEVVEGCLSGECCGGQCTQRGQVCCSNSVYPAGTECCTSDVAGNCKACVSGALINDDLDDPGACLKCSSGVSVPDNNDTCSDPCLTNPICSQGSCLGTPVATNVNPICQ